MAKDDRGASAPAIIGYIFAIILVLFGVINLYSLASPDAVNVVGRIVIAVICLTIGGGLLFFIPKWEAKKPEKIEMVQHIDLSGDISTEKLRCKNCGANLEKDSVTVKAGAVFISCPYCGSTYQITEEPTW